MNADLAAATAEIVSAASLFRSPHFHAQLMEALQEGHIRAMSKWLDRRAAGAYLHCSPSEIDRAANCGIIHRYLRNGTPLFLREEIDAAILNGTWRRK